MRSTFSDSPNTLACQAGDRVLRRPWRLWGRCAVTFCRLSLVGLVLLSFTRITVEQRPRDAHVQRHRGLTAACENTSSSSFHGFMLECNESLSLSLLTTRQVLLFPLKTFFLTRLPSTSTCAHEPRAVHRAAWLPVAGVWRTLAVHTQSIFERPRCANIYFLFRHPMVLLFFLHFLPRVLFYLHNQLSIGHLLKSDSPCTQLHSAFKHQQLHEQVEPALYSTSCSCLFYHCTSSQHALRQSLQAH